MEKIFFVMAFCIAVKHLFSVILICKKLKKWSYVFEVVLSSALFCISTTLEYSWILLVLIIIAEYLLSKILVYIYIVLIKKISFRLLVLTIRLNEESKLCDKLKELYQIEYGRKLKHGLPAMAGRLHRRSGVRFDRNGFPKFKSYYTVKLKRGDYKESREYHFYKANKILYKKALKSRRVRRMFTKADMRALKKGETPQYYTWHHHQKRGKMQLVSRDIHSLVNHIGGYSIWGAGE